eukprot:8645110-Alexandrium_andersonii.AAC.1
MLAPRGHFSPRPCSPARRILLESLKRAQAPRQRSWAHSTDGAALRGRGSLDEPMAHADRTA